MPEKCEWEKEDDEHYHTDCGHWQFWLSGNPLAECGYVFCPFCGKEIQVID